jgi:hypothetical protein
VLGVIRASAKEADADGCARDDHRG